MWSGPDPLARYERYLQTMHDVVCASVPLMLAAAERSAGEYASYLRRHAVEEQGHDAWLLEDLGVVRRFAGRAGSAGTAAPIPAVARLVWAQYYWILHHSPLCLLGYIAVLESHAPAPGLVRYLSERTRLPEAAMRTLSEHAALDGAHAAEVFDQLDRLQPSRVVRDGVVTSALATVQGLVEVFADIARAVPVPAGSLV